MPKTNSGHKSSKNMKRKLGFMLRDLHNEARVNINSEVQIIYLGHLGTLYNHWNLSHVSVWTFRLDPKKDAAVGNRTLVDTSNLL